MRTGRDLEGIRGLEGNTTSDSPNHLGPSEPAGVLDLNLSPPGLPSSRVGPGGVGVRDRGRKSGGVRGPAPLRGGGGRSSHTLRGPPTEWGFTGMTRDHPEIRGECNQRFPCPLRHPQACWGPRTKLPPFRAPSICAKPRPPPPT